MSNELVRRLVILGALSVIGIMATQSYLLIKAYNLEDRQFHETVSTSLRKVAEKISEFNGTELPKTNLITRRSSNYYAVNINDRIDAAILEDFLIVEFENKSINTDFEYGVYDCFSQNLVYGNYCQLTDGEQKFLRSNDLPKFTDLIYYFVVKFPQKESYLLNNMWQNILLSILSFLALGFFMYSTWVILEQKKLSELQKDFINNMTHEFKTPISSIKIAADVLIANEQLANNPRLLQYANIVKEQNVRLNSQVEKVLNIAKLEKDDFKLQKTKFDLILSLKDIVKNERIKFEKDDQILFKEEYDNKQINIIADRLHFTNIITNIIDNAIKYSGANKNIVVKTKLKSDVISVSISDNGIGIPKEQIGQIFTKFYRIPTGNLHNVKGFGLGLFYVKNICDAHGWKLDIESTLDEGSTFTIQLPIA